LGHLTLSAGSAIPEHARGADLVRSQILAE
jgi:hypothetical protein